MGRAGNSMQDCHGPACPQMCPNTADSTEVKRDWGTGLLKGMNSVTTECYFVSLPMFEDHQRISGLHEPTQA